MRIDFDDYSYLDFSYLNNKIQIVLAAKDGKNPKNHIVNCVEISQEQFLQITKEISSQLEQ